MIKISIKIGSCYNCGKTGHLQRDCQQASSKSCYKCKETGHLARDCTSEGIEDSRADNDDRTCYNCGKSGHISRDCPESGLNRDKDLCYRLIFLIEGPLISLKSNLYIYILK